MFCYFIYMYVHLLSPAASVAGATATAATEDDEEFDWQVEQTFSEEVE